MEKEADCVAEDLLNWDETSPKSKLSYYVDFYVAHGPEELRRIIQSAVNSDYGNLLHHKTRKCFIPICDSCWAYDIMRYIEKFSHMQYRTGLYTENDLAEFYQKVEFFALKRLDSNVSDFRYGLGRKIALP